MIAAAKKNKVMLSTFHNRHWDSNILTIMKHLRKIGRPYRWESFFGGWEKPLTWWRSDKAISGGQIYDWGAHFTEWMLQVMNDDIVSISGFSIDEVWKHVTNEDEVEALVRFKNGGVGSHTQTQLAAAGKPISESAARKAPSRGRTTRRCSTSMTARATRRSRSSSPRSAPTTCITPMCATTC